MDDDERAATDECVYWIQEGTDGPIKIGRTCNVRKRRKELQTGNARRLNVLATVPGDRHTERTLHLTFAHLRLDGEWFKPEPDLLQYITTTCELRKWDDVRRQVDDLRRQVEELQHQVDELEAEAADDDDDEVVEGRRPPWNRRGWSRQSQTSTRWTSTR